jgi:hypothetical protein
VRASSCDISSWRASGIAESERCAPNEVGAGEGGFHFILGRIRSPTLKLMMRGLQTLPSKLTTKNVATSNLLSKLALYLKCFRVQSRPQHAFYFWRSHAGSANFKQPLKNINFQPYIYLLLQCALLMNLFFPI